MAEAGIGAWLSPGRRASPFAARFLPPMSQSPPDPLSGRIFTIRGQRVILDADLARLYGTTTKRFNEAFRRNAARFPADFAFQLKSEEFAVLKSQAVISSSEVAEGKSKANMWPQIATTYKPQRRRLSNRPWAFTEHGAVMVANVLRSPKAMAMSVYVVRAGPILSVKRTDTKTRPLSSVPAASLVGSCICFQKRGNYL